jgi:hypothetical protein
MSNGRNDEVFVSDENHGMTAYTFAEKVKRRVSDLGIGNYQRPKLDKDHEGVVPRLKRGEYFDGRLPTVIRKLTLDQLSALYSIYSNWFGYVATQFMLVATERSEAMRQRDFLLTHLRNFYRAPDADGKKSPETAVTDAAKQDKRYVMANARAEELDCVYNMLSITRGIASQDMRVISREVTIQQEKFQKELLLQGFGNRGRDRDFTQALEGDDYGDAPEDPAEPGDEGASEDEVAHAKPPPSRPKVRVPRVFRR